MKKTVSFSKNAANIFFHILTQCNLRCAHCYINPQQHGDETLSLDTIVTWLNAIQVKRSSANLVLLGGEPTLHPDLADIVKYTKAMGFTSVTVDTNGYLFHDFLDKITPEELDTLSFSLDGPTADINDALRGKGSFNRCVAGIRQAKRRGFSVSLIYTVNATNIAQLRRMVPLLAELRIDRFFIQVIGIRGTSTHSAQRHIHYAIEQVSQTMWERYIPDVVRAAVELDIVVTYPKVFLAPEAPFECAGKVADNYFIFPNGRVYRCPLCEDYPIHSLQFKDHELIKTPRINETDLFQLTIPEGCVMNKLIQPGNIDYCSDGKPTHQIACCLLKQEITAD